MFQIAAAWRFSDSCWGLPGDGGPLGLSRYRCVEITWNTNIFHVAVLRGPKRDSYWGRYMFWSCDELLSALAGEEDEKVTITIQTPADEFGKFRLLAVSQILQGLDETRHTKHAYLLEDGMTYMDILSGRVEDSKDFVLVWPAVKKAVRKRKVPFETVG
jgi:hypothetical protein